MVKSPSRGGREYTRPLVAHEHADHQSGRQGGGREMHLAPQSGEFCPPAGVFRLSGTTSADFTPNPTLQTNRRSRQRRFRNRVQQFVQWIVFHACGSLNVMHGSIPCKKLMGDLAHPWAASRKLDERTKAWKIKPSGVRGGGSCRPLSRHTPAGGLLIEKAARV